MKNIGILLFFSIFLSSCKTLEPLYLSEPLRVTYKEKLQYWQPIEISRLPRNAERIRSRLYESGGILFFSYKIDSNGVAREINIEKTMPENIITSEELIESMLIYPKFKPSRENHVKQPVKVYERMVFSSKNKSLVIPPDEMSDETVLIEFSSW
jgi:hypothetical protein